MMLVLAAEAILFSAVVFSVQIPLRKSDHQSIRAALFFVKFLLIPAEALSLLAFNWPAAYLHCDLLVAFYIALCADAAASISEYAVRRTVEALKKREKSRRCMLRVNIVMTSVFAAGIFLYGYLNASGISEKKAVFSAAGLTQSHTFAFVSDIHTEDEHSADRLADLCRQINEEHPEFVILGGDITDELSSYEDMTLTYSILSEIDAPVYFIYGNHDRQPSAYRVGGRTYSDEDLTAAVTGAGIVILQDEYVKIADDLVLLGREDLSMADKRKAWSELSCPYDGALIVADHQPYDEEQLAEEESALQLSGHTHAGQLFPLQGFYRALGLPACGYFREPGTQLYVTSGFGAWGPPFRTEEHGEWVLVTLQPAQ